MLQLAAADPSVLSLPEARGGLNDAAAAAWTQTGAILLRGLLGEDFFRPVEQAMHARLRLLEQREGLTPGEADTLDALSARLIALEAVSPQAQSAFYDNIALAPQMHHAAGHPALLKAVTRLLSDVIAIHPRLILLMSAPGNRWQLAGWHQDWYYNEGPQNTLTAYIPFQDTGRENGGLQLALSDAPWTLQPHGDFDDSTKWHTIEPGAVTGFGQIARPELARGDVLLFHSLVPHSAQVNQSDAVRFVANFRYRDLCDAAFLQDYWKIGSISHAREALARKNTA